jgi:hypothetical protein
MQKHSRLKLSAVMWAVVWAVVCTVLVAMFMACILGSAGIVYPVASVCGLA